MSFGGSGSSGPTAQQVALQTEQATTNANLNLEENEQRKTILNALQGTRVFRGSALSRQMATDEPAAGNTSVNTPMSPKGPAPAQTQPLNTADAGTQQLPGSLFSQAEAARGGVPAAPVGGIFTGSRGK